MGTGKLDILFIFSIDPSGLRLVTVVLNETALHELVETASLYCLKG